MKITIEFDKKQNGIQKILIIENPKEFKIKDIDGESLIFQDF